MHHDRRIRSFARIYQAAYDDLIKTHKYHLLTRNQKIMCPGTSIIRTTSWRSSRITRCCSTRPNPELLAIYKESLERSWQVERPERNPLWNAIYAAGTGARDFDRAESASDAARNPDGHDQLDGQNSDRLDVPVDPLADRFGPSSHWSCCPTTRLPMWKWNGNPYSLDGGNGGRSEDDGAYFLCPTGWQGFITCFSDRIEGSLSTCIQPLVTQTAAHSVRRF